jgi:2-dehydro-3-deoxygluconokinase
MAMKIRPVSECQLDLVAFGECMIRLSPKGHGRIEFAPELEVWVGGGEYNVAYALARLGLRTGWVGGLNSSPMGAIIRNHARSVGMDVSHVVERKYDGVGKKDRIGLNFTEVGHSKRASTTLYDRGHSATAGMKPGDVDWKKLFARGVRWFHTGGIMASLSETTRQVVAEAVKAAHEAGTIVSYDLNFRSKLWSSKEAIATTKPLVPYIDCLIGNEEDFEKVLGYEAEGVNVEKAGSLDVGPFKKMVERVVKDFPNIKVVGTTLRGVKTALVNDWSAIMWHEGTFYDGLSFPDLEIEDRVGGGDGFASGFTYGFLTGQEPQACVNLGVAHGALLMSTRGDTSQITLDELLHVAGGGSARIKR